MTVIVVSAPPPPPPPIVNQNVHTYYPVEDEYDQAVMQYQQAAMREYADNLNLIVSSRLILNYICC